MGRNWYVSLACLVEGDLQDFIIVASLCRKYQKAKTSVETMESAAEELTKSIGNKHWILEWKKLEETARTKRGDALMIYNVSDTPGLLPIPVIFFHLSLLTAPSKTKKKQDLIKTGGKDIHVQWLLEGLNLEAEQLVLVSLFHNSAKVKII